MKFEKITDSKIRIFFTIEDMISNKISAQEFFSDSSISQRILQSVLTQAEKEIGFHADDNKLLVEAIASDEGGCIFTITKLFSYDNSELHLGLFFKFENLEDFLSLCQSLKIMNFDINILYKNCSLFLCRSTYYLVISNVDNIPFNIVPIFSEFGENLPYSPILEGLLNEYGKNICNKNNFEEYVKYIH